MTDLAVVRQDLQTTLQTFAQTLNTIQPDDIPAALQIVRKLEELGEELGDRFRNQLIERLKESGEKVTDKGSLRMEIGDRTVQAIPTRTGLDPKKVETALRRKGLDPSAYMDTTLTFKVNEAKLMAAEFSLDELKQCAYTLAYRVTVE